MSIDQWRVKVSYTVTVDGDEFSSPEAAKRSVEELIKSSMTVGVSQVGGTYVEVDAVKVGERWYEAPPF